LSAAVVPPGGEGKIEARFRTANHPGPFKKTVRVTSNDPDKPVVVLTISGVVQ